MDTHKKIREHISAFSDGELARADQELALAALDSADGRQAWQAYCRIGDVLRAQGGPDLSDGFSARLAARLAHEPVPVPVPATARRGARASTSAPAAEPTSAAGKRGPAAAAAAKAGGAAKGGELGEEARAATELASDAGGSAEPVAVVVPKPPIISVS